MFSVAARAVPSAESLTLSVVRLGWFWTLTAARMPWTLPLLPTLTVSSATPFSVMAMRAEVSRMLTVSPALTVLTTNGEAGLTKLVVTLSTVSLTTGTPAEKNSEIVYAESTVRSSRFSNRSWYLRLGPRALVKARRERSSCRRNRFQKLIAVSSRSKLGDKQALDGLHRGRGRTNGTGAQGESGVGARRAECTANDDTRRVLGRARFPGPRSGRLRVLGAPSV